MECIKKETARLCSQKSKTNMTFGYEYKKTIAEVRECIRECEGKHSQQVAYSTFHDCLTQICFGCKKVRTSLKYSNDH